MVTVNIEMEDWERYRQLEGLDDALGRIEKMQNFSLSCVNGEWSATFIDCNIKQTIKKERWDNLVEFLKTIGDLL